MGSLVDVIKGDAGRKAVVDDCVKLIDSEVADKRGLSGMAVKGAFKTVKSFKPGMIGASMNMLLDDFAAQVDPHWQTCQTQGADARQYFSSKKVEIANALLKVTDDRAEQSRHRTLVKAYKSLRGKAVDHIGQAMPRFADLLVKHAS